MLASVRRLATEPGAGGLAARLCLAVARLVHAHRYGQEWETAVEQAMRAARSDGEDSLAAQLLCWTATIHSDHGDLPAAAGCFAQAATAFHALADHTKELTARMNHAVVRHLLGHTREAANAYTTALGIAKELENLRLQAYALANLAAVRRELGEYRYAVSNAEAAHEIFRAIGDWQGEADAIQDSAQTHRLTGDAPAATAAYRAALALVAGRDRRREAAVLHQLGETLSLAGDVAEAVTVLRKAVQALDDVGAPEVHAARQSLARVERTQPADERSVPARSDRIEARLLPAT